MNIKISIACVILIGVVLITALILKGDVKANFRMLGAAFSLETTARK